jgi:phage replication O-like protein O
VANPQPDRFTMIANELLEQVPKFKFNGTQLRIILVIWRYTYGFKRKQKGLSASYLSEATGISKRQIERELSELIKLNVVTVVLEALGRRPRTLKFNKDYEVWDQSLVPTNRPVQIEMPSIDGLDGSASTDSSVQTDRSIDGLVGQEIKIFKETLKEIIYCIFTHWNNSKIIKHKKLTNHIETQLKWKLNEYSSDELIECITNYSIILNDQNYVLTTRWGLDTFFEKGHFEKFQPDRDPFNYYPKVKPNSTHASKSKFERNKERLTGKSGVQDDGSRSEVHPIQSVGSLPAHRDS